MIKNKYDKNLKRIYRGFNYFDNPLVSDSEKAKHIDKFRELLKEQSLLLKELGLKSGDKEILEGFATEERRRA